LRELCLKLLIIIFTIIKKTVLAEKNNAYKGFFKNTIHCVNYASLKIHFWDAVNWFTCIKNRLYSTLRQINYFKNALTKKCCQETINFVDKNLPWKFPSNKEKSFLDSFSRNLRVVRFVNASLSQTFSFLFQLVSQTIHSFTFQINQHYVHKKS
jgi:hypothetical protein